MEAILLADTYEYFLGLLKEGRIKFGLPLLFSIHKVFLSILYSWAGKPRSVDISKDGMLFASVKFLDRSLEGLRTVIKKKLPKKEHSKEKTAERMALIHNEFNAIHPFREGNGRTIRLFLDLLAISLGYGYIWDKYSKNDYFKACKEGIDGNNEPMAKIIRNGLKKVN